MPYSSQDIRVREGLQSAQPPKAADDGETRLLALQQAYWTELADLAQRFEQTGRVELFTDPETLIFQINGLERHSGEGHSSKNSG
jgi:hypothetical protein